MDPMPAKPTDPGSDSDEEVLDAENWKKEAAAVIKDVGDHVNYFAISKKLESCNTKIFLNLTTKEGNHYTIEQSALGFQVVGTKHDSEGAPSSEVYDTPYALLGEISPKYRDAFGKTLMKKLEALNEDRSC